jgi:hypothetical protein
MILLSPKAMEWLKVEEWGDHSAVQQFFIAVPASLYTVVFLQSGCWYWKS